MQACTPKAILGEPSAVLAAVRPVFHFDRIVAKRSVFLCFLFNPGRTNDFETK